ncbi:hypothetical protein Aeqsu_1332 [Aequorivita sublithincola DSM 14238]|uniref:Secretion system C-terminal sorting domain-containing protein n=1 Tax=Aequorivita sublithincola (strain DSM 14238 / LMG 21431 / ACAM 643 / 9-3) TaxID=746697 RepID=I3YV07_AEQSU|nr:T9SS type A sorting domain-containing protein [Aequorivita sublithincola]AFL80825.1 hypothetical protein Aeqsu_1332 [Aequorivita sublithincola DSM 14238]
MKKLLYILLFNITAISFAQNPQLFDNTWYLQKLNIDGIDYYTPNNSEIDFIPLNIYQEFLDTKVCLSLSGYQLTITNTDINIFEFIILPDNPCVLSENNDYENLYYNGFLEWQFLDKTFSYVIEEVGANLALTINNDSGDKAYYGNTPLTVNTFSNNLFSIFPNPVKNELTINSNQVTGKLNIKIFNIEGKLLSTQSLDIEKQTSIAISSLSNGIYFLNIEDEMGNTTVKKFIKE